MNNQTTVMLIDDDADDRLLFKEALREIDAHLIFTEASNGEEGIQLLADSSEKLPEVIFLDLNMPGIPGKECLKRLKSHERLKNIPVIIYSTIKHCPEIEETKRMGALDFIMKPSTFEGICKAVDDALKTIQQHLTQPQH